jgi:hypothetical protein
VTDYGGWFPAGSQSKMTVEQLFRDQYCAQRKRRGCVKHRVYRSLIAAALLLGLAGLARSADKPKPPQAPANTRKIPSVPINPHALEILDQMCKVFTSAKAFSYHAEINFDSVLPSDVKLQFAAAMDVALARPDHLAVSYDSDLGGKRMWYDGKTVTVLDPAHMTYATVAAPPSIDKMLEQFAKERNVSIPLEGFDFSHPCERIRGNLLHGAYVGVGDVDGVDYDHLAFTQKSVDWQIWIDRTKRPLPRKVVITYTSLPMAPQYSAVLTHWNFDPKFPADFFAPQIPKKALRIKFIEMKEKRK